MADAEATVQDFRVGSVLGRGFSILFKNIVPFGLLSVLVMSPTYIFALVVDPQIYLQATEPTTEVEFSALGVAVTIAESLLSFLLTAALVYGTFQELRGRRARLGDCVGRGLALILPVIGVAILVGLLVGLASLLLVIPGLIVMTMLWVAIPVAVIEKPGVSASLSRSTELTKDYRWQIFGLIVVLYILAFVVIFAFAMTFQIIAANSIGNGLVWVDLVLNLVIAAFFTALWAVVSAVGYHDLRVVKEGVDVEQIAAVFD